MRPLAACQCTISLQHALKQQRLLFFFFFFFFGGGPYFRCHLHCFCNLMAAASFSSYCFIIRIRFSSFLSSSAISAFLMAFSVLYRPMVSSSSVWVASSSFVGLSNSVSFFSRQSSKCSCHSSPMSFSSFVFFLRNLSFAS